MNECAADIRELVIVACVSAAIGGAIMACVIRPKRPVSWPDGTALRSTRNTEIEYGHGWDPAAVKVLESDGHVYSSLEDWRQARGISRDEQASAS